MAGIKEGCDDPRHKDHMCQIVYNGDFERAAKLAEDAEYICKQCGRSAKSKDNLCAPTKTKGYMMMNR